MRLNFSILWFDDTSDFFDSLDIDWLKSQVSSWGFSPDINLVTTPKDFLSYKPYKKFDLIVIDRNLEEYGEGQDFIAELRSNAIYTEIIFYTSAEASDLWDAIKAKQLEGVFVCNKTTILTKISRVGYQVVRKVLDLENMRGIVMAEVGELDHMLTEIIIIGVNNLPVDQQQVIFEKFHAEAHKQNLELGGRLETFLTSPSLEEMLNLCDSNKRWESFNRLWKLHDKLKGQEKVGNYKVEVLDLRNILAHGRPEVHKDGFLFNHHGKEYFFNDEASDSIRQTILKYKNKFDSVRETLKA